MGVSNITLYNGRYAGGLTEDVCSKLDTIIQLNSLNGELSDLRGAIKNLGAVEIESVISGSGLVNYDDAPCGDLRADQTLGVGFMLLSQKCILGDSVGLGKTVISAAVLRYLYNNFGKRALVLTEKSVVPQFREELVRFTGYYYDCLLSGEARDVKKFINRNPVGGGLSFAGVVGSHALLSTKGFMSWLAGVKESEGKFPFDILVVDESSILGGKAKTLLNGYKAMYPFFSHIYFLNATPFESNLMTFYNQLNLLDKKYLPTKERFQKDFCVMDYSGMFARPTNNYKNQDKFRDLVGYRYFARTREDKGAVMIDCEGGLILSPLSKAQKSLLSRTQMKRLVYDCPQYLDGSVLYNEENVPKLGDMLRLLGEFGDVPVLVYSYYKDAQEALGRYLESKGYSVCIVNGDTSVEERIEKKKGFREGRYRIFITNIQKGLNFDFCNHCIFYSYDTNPSRMVQFEGRITRSFDIVGKNVYILCSEGSEHDTLMSVVKARASATGQFARADLSVVLNILLEGR